MRAYTWEEGFLDAAEQLNEESAKEVDCTYLATRSFGDEFGGAIGADISLLNIAIVLNLVYANIQMTQWNKVRAFCSLPPTVVYKRAVDDTGR